MIAEFLVDRPIFATVISVVIVLAGGVAVFTLPVAQYPEVTPPTVQVTAVYPGANATTVRDTVGAPIEEQVSGVENMLYMSSQCTNDGTYNLTVTFKLGTAVFSGMLGVTLFGVFLTPVFFYVIQGVGETRIFARESVQWLASCFFGGLAGAASGYLLARLGWFPTFWATLVGAGTGILIAVAVLGIRRTMRRLE